MKNILTAINNPNLNEQLKKEKNIKIEYKDIQYKEAIIEILEKNKEIDIIIISENIPGEINIFDLIKKIKNINNKIKIIIILEKENKLIEEKLYKNNIKDIYYNNKINIKKLINIIKEKEINNEEELKKEINELKKIIEKNKLKNNKEKSYSLNKKRIVRERSILQKIIFKIKERIFNNSKFLLHINGFHNVKSKRNIFSYEPLTISISGYYAAGKSTIALILAKFFCLKNKESIILDFNSLDTNIYSIIPNIEEKNIKNVDSPKKYIKKKKNKIQNYKIFQNKNIIQKLKLNKKNKIINNYKLISKINIQKEIKNYEKEINKKIKLINLNKIIKKYNILISIKIIKEIFLKNKEKNLIIDIGYKENAEIEKFLIKKSKKNLIIIEPNLTGIKQAKTIIDKYLYKYKINKKSILILFNKYNNYSININILKRNFKIFKKIYKIKYNNKFNSIINNKKNINYIYFFIKIRNLLKYIKFNK